MVDVEFFRKEVCTLRRLVWSAYHSSQVCGEAGGLGWSVCVFNWVLLEACGSAPTSALSANVLYEAAGA